MDLNHGPLGYEPSELPSCSTPRRHVLYLDSSLNNTRLIRSVKILGRVGHGMGHGSGGRLAGR